MIENETTPMSQPEEEPDMSTGLAKSTTMDADAIKALIIGGDMSKLDEKSKVTYYRSVCDSLGLNPLTQPFSYLKLNGKEILYANRACTEQLRKINGVSVGTLDGKQVGDVYIVTCHVKDSQGRSDISTGAVNVKGLQGDNLANALMKAETKSKRRATLSICGLGFLDESEVETIQHDPVKQIPYSQPAESKFATPTTPVHPPAPAAPAEPRTTINKNEASVINGLLIENGVPWEWLLRKLEVTQAREITLKQLENILANIGHMKKQYDEEQLEDPFTIAQSDADETACAPVTN